MQHLLAINITIWLLTIAIISFSTMFIALLLWPREKRAAYGPSDNAIWQYDYLGKLIDKIEDIPDAQLVERKISQYEMKFIEDPDVPDLSKQLRERVKEKMRALIF